MDMYVKIRNVLILFLILEESNSCDAVFGGCSNGYVCQNQKCVKDPDSDPVFDIFADYEESNSCDAVFGCSNGYVCQNQKCVKESDYVDPVFDIRGK